MHYFCSLFSIWYIAIILSVLFHTKISRFASYQLDASKIEHNLILLNGWMSVILTFSQLQNYMYLYIRIFNGSNSIDWDLTWLDLYILFDSIAIVCVNQMKVFSVQCSVFNVRVLLSPLLVVHQQWMLWIGLVVGWCRLLPSFEEIFGVCVCVNCEYGCSLFNVRVCLCVRYPYINGLLFLFIFHKISHKMC